MLRYFFPLVMTPFVLLSAAVHAATPSTAEQRVPYGLDAGLEYYQWKETDASGRNLLTETGPRFSFGGFFGNLPVQPQGLLYKVDGRIYFGLVNYDGQDFNSVALNSDTEYSGMALEGQLGYRWSINARYGADVIAGAGLDAWRRGIQAADNVQGQPVSGLEEFYGILYTKLGAGPSFHTPTWQAQMHAGVKYPFNTEEQANLVDIGYADDAILSPVGRASGFVSLNNQFTLGGSKQLSVDFFYDSYRFAPSKADTVYNGSQYVQVHQPKSAMDVIGVQFGAQF